jgi:hypothetical protein
LEADAFFHFIDGGHEIAELIVGDLNRLFTDPDAA